MIAKNIVTQLKIISAITSIFWTNIYAWSKFKMQSWKFLVVSPLTTDSYRELTEIWPLSNRYPYSFMMVGEMSTTENTMFWYLETLTEELWVWCGMLHSFGWVTVHRLQRGTVSPVVYNQERPVLTADFTFIV